MPIATKNATKGPSTHGEEFGGDYSTNIRRQRI